MLLQETLDKLRDLRLGTMADALTEQLAQPTLVDGLSFEERFGLLVDREWTARMDKRLKRRLKQAKLRDPAACVEDIDYKHPRGLDRAIMRSLITCEWVRRHQNVLITGPTGCGKTFLACALVNKACREGFSAMYVRLPRLVHQLEIARADGTYVRFLDKLARIHVLVFDDWGLTPLKAVDRRDLLEILDDRHCRRATVVTSQFPIEAWHKHIADPTLADGILDRLVHNAHKLELKLTGKSMRERLKPEAAS